MRKTNTDGIRDFQYINKKTREIEKDTYKGIKITFLKALWGEDWKSIFDNIYGNDLRQFWREWRIDYNEWNEFEE